jgi:hypothetical protein
MEINQNLGANAQRKMALLITKASDLGMKLSSYGEVGENDRSGNVYLWLEDYPFTLFIGLGSDDIWALWSNPEDGEETVTNVIDEMTLENLYDWVSELEQQTEEEEA